MHRRVTLSLRLFSLCLAAVVFCLGCGKSGPEMVPVRGTVTFGGKPLPTGIVKFIPESGPPSPAAIGQDGTYQTKAVPGKHTVVVTATSQPAGAKENPAAEGGMDYSGAAPARSLIPRKYNLPHTSGIVKTVQAGEENTIDIQLQ